MKILKFLIIILVLTTFFFLINHYINLENYKVSFDNESIPIIEADNKPIKIRQKYGNNRYTNFRRITDRRTFN